MAVHPVDPQRLVIASHHSPDAACAYVTSSDAGDSWSAVALLPLARPDDFCSDPVVRVAPDGSFFYVIYMSIDPFTFTNDVVVFRVTGDFSGTSGPFVAISLDPDVLYDKPWVGVHTFQPGLAPRVYVTATAFRLDGACDIVFSRSGDGGVTWPRRRDPTVLAASPICFPTLQGSHVVGGPDDNVLACWYDSEADGFLAGVFDVRCRRSVNRGDTFRPEVTAVNDESDELPSFVCPVNTYHRLFGAMFPDVKIAPDGSAHVVYAHDPTLGGLDGECGDVRYVRSPGPPYTTWSAPITLGSSNNPRAQYYASITVQRALRNRCVLHLGYVNHQTSPAFAPNIIYDMYRRQSDDCGSTWSPATRITSRSSLSDFFFIGDYTDAAASTQRIHFTWTDRRDKISILDLEDDVFTDRFSAP